MRFHPWVLLAIRIYRLWQPSALLLQFSGRAHYHRIMPHYEAASVRLAASPDRWEGKREKDSAEQKERAREGRTDQVNVREW